MRAFRYKSLMVFGLLLTLGLSTAFAGDKDKDDANKRPKNTGILSVQTEKAPLPVFIDGQNRGMSGVGTGFEWYLTPGIHTVEVKGPNGAVYTKEVQILKNQKICICLKVRETRVTKDCPYFFSLEIQDKDKVRTEGDIVTLTANYSGTIPSSLHYKWTVTPDTVTGSSKLDGSTITIDTTGMGGRTIEASVYVDDDLYDHRCHQNISTSIPVEKKPEPPVPHICDEVDAPNKDQAKARFDSCVLQLTTDPNASYYAVIYPGTDKISTTVNSYDKSRKWMFDYLVNKRRIDANRIRIVQGSTRVKTRFVVWIIPAGASLPPIN